MANSNITKKALAQSLKELGSTKILDKITVADITNHCGVNRQTFYYHFNDKYELLNWIYTEDLFKPLTKDELVTPQEYRMRAEGDYSRKKIAEVYEEYETILYEYNQVL